MTTEARLTIDFPQCLAEDFPGEFPAARQAVDRVLAVIDGVEHFTPLEDRSPGLRGNDWSNYLRCSEARMVHAARMLKRAGITSGRVLDYGAYFGNFALMCRELGFAVDAADSYSAYSPALDRVTDLLRSRGVVPVDFDVVGRTLEGLAADRYDVVLCMGVIEHVPHTPRMLLEALHRVMAPGGALLIDTPNLVHLFNRQRFSRGESVMPPIEIQYRATVPFEGHHREYTVDEVLWMLASLGHDIIGCDLFNYSVYGYDTLTGRDVSNFWRTVVNPTMRELILAASRKPADGRRRDGPVNWTETFEDAERYWSARVPDGYPEEGGAGILETEALVVDLQRGIDSRDRMLGDLQHQHLELGRQLSQAHGEIGALMDRLGSLQYAFDMTPFERVKRWWRRVTGRERAKREA